MKDMLSKEEFKNMMLELEREINNLSYNLHTIKVEDILKQMREKLEASNLNE